jgi:hypothetical protein
VSFAFTAIGAGQQTGKIVMQNMAGICFGTGPSVINANHYNIRPLPAQNRVHVNSMVPLRSLPFACTAHKKTGQLMDQASRSNFRIMVSCSGSPAIFARPVAFRIHNDQDSAFSEPAGWYYNTDNMSTLCHSSWFYSRACSMAFLTRAA